MAVSILLIIMAFIFLGISISSMLIKSIDKGDKLSMTGLIMAMIAVVASMINFFVW